VTAVELTNASDSLMRVADAVIADVATESDADASFRIPPFATTVHDADIDADPV